MIPPTTLKHFNSVRVCVFVFCFLFFETPKTSTVLIDLVGGSHKEFLPLGFVVFAFTSQTLMYPWLIRNTRSAASAAVSQSVNGRMCQIATGPWGSHIMEHRSSGKTAVRWPAGDSVPGPILPSTGRCSISEMGYKCSFRTVTFGSWEP